MVGPAEDFLESAQARWGVYGRNGAGKSTLLASIPDTEKELVLVEEGQNIKPYKGVPHIKVGIVHTWDDVVEAHHVVHEAKRGGTGPTAVGFDGWPIRLIINEVTGAHLEPGEEKDWLRKPPDTYPDRYEQWDKVSALSTWGMLAYFRLPVHLIFTFDEDDPKVEKGEVTKRGGPLLPNQPLKGVKKHLELLGRLFAETINNSLQLDSGIPMNAQEQRRLLLGENEFWFAKGPVHALGYSIVNPTWTKMLPALTAEPLRLNGYHNEEVPTEEKF